MWKEVIKYFIVIITTLYFATLRSQILDIFCTHFSGLLRYAFTFALPDGVIQYGHRDHAKYRATTSTERNDLAVDICIDIYSFGLPYGSEAILNSFGNNSYKAANKLYHHHKE